MILLILLFLPRNRNVRKDDGGLTLENAGTEVLGLVTKVVLILDITTIIGCRSSQGRVKKPVAKAKTLLRWQLFKLGVLYCALLL